MQHDVQRHRLQLSPISFDRRSYNVEKFAINLKNSYVYNFAGAGGINEVAYKASMSSSTMFLPPNRNSMLTYSPYDSPLSIQFLQASTSVKYSYVRGDLSGTFQRFGSYLALILRFAGYCIQDFQGFSKTNSMIKKLYTKDKKKGKKKDEKQEGLLNASGNDRELGGDKREEVIDEVAGR